MISMVECTRCGKVFKYESERKRHELSHLPGFGCNKCGKKFTYVSALKRHEKQHERTGTVQCDKCNHSFKDEVLLKRHYKYAHEGTHICNECEAQFSSHQALRIHTLTHKPKSERRYSCRYMNCNKTFNFSHHLKYHEMTHTDSRQHFCNVCGKGFIQSHNLKVHMKVHELSKRLFCEMPNCKKKFVSESARKRHYALHKKVPNDKELSEIVIDTSSPSVGTSCSACGQIVSPSFSKDHKLVCVGRNIDNTTKELSIGQLSKLSEDEFEVDIEKEFHVDINDSTECVSTCRSILGKCLVTGDTNGTVNCLCDQMVKAEHKSNKVSEERVEVNKESLSDVTDTNAIKITCDDCMCSTAESNTKHTNEEKVNEENMKKDNNECMPEFEYGVNGVIKVINTIDVELEGIVNICKNTKPKSKSSKCNVVPYNSCKAVLGTCIVSGSGMISDDCLCAKMLIDDQQMTSQEMEEITPQPNDSTMCL